MAAGRDAVSPEAGGVRSLAHGIPNALTVVRLVLGLAFPLLPEPARLPVLVAGAATEFLDGFLARIMGAVSLTGQILDPIADRVFVVALLLTLLADGTLGIGTLLFVAARDVMVVVGSLTVALTRGTGRLREMRPSPLGKVATTLQLVLLLVLVATGRPVAWVVALTGAVSVAAGVDYMRRFW